MGNFDTAYELLKKWENRKVKGGLIVWSNDPDDLGGETVYGISKRSFPNWECWDRIAEIKKSLNKTETNGLDYALELSNKVAVNYPFIEQKAKSLYKNIYWDKFNGDEIPNERFANGSLLITVNAGFKNGMKVIQRSLGLDDDGIYGPKTRAALSKVNDNSVELLRQEQIKYYDMIIVKRPVNEKYRQGWYNRANSF